MSEEKIQEAKTMFDPQIVDEIMELVRISDADGAYTLYEDMGKYEHAECIEYLYFEE